jgi:hypothetical protein
MPDNIKVRMNPNFTADAMKQAESVIGAKIENVKHVLQQLEQGETLPNHLLALLSHNGYITVANEPELHFVSFTDKGRDVLHS